MILRQTQLFESGLAMSAPSTHKDSGKDAAFPGQVQTLSSGALVKRVSRREQRR